VSNDLKMTQYNSILEKINAFITAILGDDNLSSQLLLKDSDMNCLVSKEITFNQETYHSNNESFLYSLQNNRLFEQKTIYLADSKTLVRSFEIIFIKRSCEDPLDITSKDQKLRIIVNKIFVHPSPPKNKLEEWIRSRNSKIVPGGFFCRYSFTRSLFNSDLDFTEEEIESALKKITSVEIVDNQLIFTADDSE
jgi:hypothetical protein